MRYIFELVRTEEENGLPEVAQNIDPETGLPKQTTAISQNEFFHRIRKMHYKWIEHLSVVVKEGTILEDLFPNKLNHVLDIRIFWGLNKGLGIVLPSKWRSGQDEYEFGIIYENPTYLYFGCRHKDRIVPEEECKRRGIPHYGKCYTVFECEECGRIKGLDSSD